MLTGSSKPLRRLAEVFARKAVDRRRFARRQASPGSAGLSFRSPRCGDRRVRPVTDNLRKDIVWHDYDALVAAHPPADRWGEFPESAAAGLCFTSGTTSRPKGVLYSDRSNFLHTLMVLQGDVHGLSARDVILPIVPMFHANAWGLAFSAPAVGAKLVMPGENLDPAVLAKTIELEVKKSRSVRGENRTGEMDAGGSVQVTMCCRAPTQPRRGEPFPSKLRRSRAKPQPPYA